MRSALEKLVLVRQMQRIRGCYRILVPEGEQFFGPAAEEERFSAAMATLGLRARPAMLFAQGQWIAAINGVVDRVGLAMGTAWRWGSLPPRCCSGCTCYISSSGLRLWFCGHPPRHHRDVHRLRPPRITSTSPYGLHTPGQGLAL